MAWWRWLWVEVSEAEDADDTAREVVWSIVAGAGVCGGGG